MLINEAIYKMNTSCFHWKIAEIVFLEKKQFFALISIYIEV